MPKPRGALVALTLATCCIAFVPSTGHAQRKERDVVKRDEILAAGQGDQDLFAALRTLRPRFLEPPPGVRTLGNSMRIPTAVIVDGRRMGDLDMLHSIIASSVDEVRYYEPSKAGTEFGQSASGGAVVIKLAKAGKPKASDSTPPQPDGGR